MKIEPPVVGIALSFPVVSLAGNPFSPPRKPSGSSKTKSSSVWTPAIKDAAEQLDRLHDHVEEWGIVTLSAFVLAPANSAEVPVLVPVEGKDGKVQVDPKDGSILREPVPITVLGADGQPVKDASGNFAKTNLTQKIGTFEFNLRQTGQDCLQCRGVVPFQVQPPSRAL